MDFFHTTSAKEEKHTGKDTGPNSVLSQITPSAVLIPNGSSPA